MGTYDIYRANVVSLLHFNGANNSTTFTDEKGKTWSRTGSPVISTSRSVFGGASYYAAGSGCKLSCAYNTDWDLSTADFTIEAWVYNTGSSSASLYASIFNKRAGGADFDYQLWHAQGGRQLYFSWGDTSSARRDIATPTNSMPADTWNHVAVTRQGTTLRLFVNGTLHQTATISGSLRNRSIAAEIGQSNSYSDSYVIGNIDELRVTKGVARYTSNFTVPTTEFSLSGLTIAGVVQAGAPPVPVRRKVVLTVPERAALVGEGYSDAGTGAYSIETTADIWEVIYGLAYPDYGTVRRASTAYALAAKGFPVVPNGHWYEVESAGTSGGAEPTWPTDGSTVTDGTVVWRDKGAMEEPIARGPYVTLS